MEGAVKGDVVVVPFSDLSQAKRRPALVVCSLPGDDVILCQITSQAHSDPLAIRLLDSDIGGGALRQESRIRPNRLFTADQRLILYAIGRLAPAKLSEVVDAIVDLLRR